MPRPSLLLLHHTLPVHGPAEAVVAAAAHGRQVAGVQPATHRVGVAHRPEEAVVVAAADGGQAAVGRGGVVAVAMAVGRAHGGYGHVPQALHARGPPRGAAAAAAGHVLGHGQLELGGVAVEIVQHGLALPAGGRRQGGAKGQGWGW